MNKNIKAVLSGKISRETDEKGAGGFYDLALEIAADHTLDRQENLRLELTEAIYNALWELYEAKAEDIRYSGAGVPCPDCGNLKELVIQWCEECGTQALTCDECGWHEGQDE